MAYEAFHPPISPAIGGPAAVQAALLKEIGKQLVGTVGGDPLRVGQVVQAQIGTDADGATTLLLGGVKVPAHLPAELVPGQLLRLQVKESSPERVVLQIVKGPEVAPATAATAEVGPSRQVTQAQGPAAQAAASVVPWAVIPMPGGAQARVWLDPDGAADDAAAGSSAARRRTMVIRYDSPVLGRTDVVLHLDPAQLDAHVLAPAGQPLELVRQSVAELRLALAGAVDRPVAVVTGGRSGGEEVDLRA